MSFMAGHPQIFFYVLFATVLYWGFLLWQAGVDARRGGRALVPALAWRVGIFALSGVFALALVGLFIAWWIVVLALAGISAYVTFRRLIGDRRGRPRGGAQSPGEPQRSGETVVIEGEYRIEHDSRASQAPHDRSESG